MSPLSMSLFPLFLLFVAATHQQDFQPYVPIPKPPNMESKFGVKYDEALEAIFSVAVRLEALLSNTGAKTSKNFMVSPLSMAVAVGELLLGARGKLQEQLYDLLVIDSTLNRSDSVRHLNNKDNKIPYYPLHEQLGDLLQNLQRRGTFGQTYSLRTASVLFKQFNLNINENFRANIQSFYGTEIKDLDFANDPINSERIVNQWAYDNTNGLIRSILPGPVSRQTVAILANSVYFRGDWEIPFSSQINRVGKFHTSPNNHVNVTFMMGEFENYKYVESKKLNCKMVVIPYQNHELSMYILLPNTNNSNVYDINKFTSDLRTKDILELIQQARQRKVFIMLPKMSLSNTISVLGPLKKYHNYKNNIDLVKTLNAPNGDQFDRLDDRVNLFKNVSNSGLSDRFSNDQLDLSGISTDPRFYVSDIYQQMTLSVHEKGTEAAAVAASAIDYIADSVSMRVDRPFLFFIRHEATEASLFWGTIGDPTESQ